MLEGNVKVELEEGRKEFSRLLWQPLRPHGRNMGWWGPWYTGWILPGQAVLDVQNCLSTRREEGLRSFWFSKNNFGSGNGANVDGNDENQGKACITEQEERSLKQRQVLCWGAWRTGETERGRHPPRQPTIFVLPAKITGRRWRFLGRTSQTD